jgi:hypothetical protein
MSGFTRDPYWYGGLLVYEPLDSKWRRYHARCRQPGCTGYWLDHALKAGFRYLPVPALTRRTLLTDAQRRLPRSACGGLD